MTRTSIFLAFSLAVFFANPASAATYYVDSGAGVDASDGLSPATAWRTRARVNAQTLAPGDVVRFKRSQVWYESTDLAPESGTQALPIVFDAYGTGEAPIISGAIHSGLEGLTWTPSSAQPDTYYLSQGGADPVIKDRSSPFTIWRLFRASDDVELFEGSLGGLNDAEWAYGDVDALGFATIYIRDDAGTPPDVLIPQAKIPFRLFGRSWIEIHNLTVDKAADTGIWMGGQQVGLTVKNTTVRDGGGPGLNYGGVDVAFTDTHVTLEDSRFLNNGRVGAVVTGFFHEFISEGILPTVNIGVMIKGCEFAFNDEDGLKLFYINDSRVTENVLHDNGTVVINDRGGSGVVFDGSAVDTNGNNLADFGVGCANNEVDRNIAYNNGNSGIIFEFFATGNDIHHNLVYDNGSVEFSGGISVNHSSFENIIRYNVVLDHQAGFLLSSLYQGDGQESTGNVFVHNTTVRDTTGGNHVYVVNGTDAIIKNNIMVNQTSLGGVVGQGRNEHIENGPPPPGDQEFDYNVWVLRNQMRWGNIFWGLSDYQANTIHGDNTVHSTVPIPFASPGMPDFAYIPGTNPPVSLVGATDLPASIYADGDFFGQPVNIAAPTRGAFETGDACSTGPECGDGEFCNGDELCSGTGVCYPGPSPCGTQLCRESDDTCVDCLDGSVCDDSVFCNGTEQCDPAGTCLSGTDPCPGQDCDEASDTCVASCGDIIPGEVTGLMLSRNSSSVATLTWSALAVADDYSVHRGSNPELSDIACFQSGILSTSTADDGATPPENDLFVYLVTGSNCVGVSTLGEGRGAAPVCP